MSFINHINSLSTFFFSWFLNKSLSSHILISSCDELFRNSGEGFKKSGWLKALDDSPGPNEAEVYQVFIVNCLEQLCNA